jgi:hypothetical protein
LKIIAAVQISGDNREKVVLAGIETPFLFGGFRPPQIPLLNPSVQIFSCLYLALPVGSWIVGG